MNQDISILGYGFAGVAFATLLVFMLTVWRERMRGSLLPIACLITAGWGCVLAYSGLQTSISAFALLMLELLQDLAWLVFLSSLLGGAIATGYSLLIRRGGVIVSAGLLIFCIVIELTQSESRAAEIHGPLLVFGSLATSLFALVGIEQIYRNSRPMQRLQLKFLCVGLAGMFAYDLVLYSDAIVSGNLSPLLWGVRGFVVALCAPMIAASVRRLDSWKRGIFVSRQVVFYTTTLIAAGIYLAVIGFVGYFIQKIGSGWGPTLQVVFFVAAALAFAVLLLSDRLRRNVRVFIAKHFFERKYDYRAEWLRLIGTLTSGDDGLPLKKRAIKSLADIVTAPAGHLWTANDSGKRLRSVASWNVPAGHGEIDARDDICEFLREKSWVLDLAEMRFDPEKYAPLNVSDLHEEIVDMSYVVPLMEGRDLLGFVTLLQPATPTPLNFEDHDLLKTAGRQVASYLAQEAATEQLAEGAQFEAFNRFTAYVMHDLKNAIAQQSLVVKNAEKHKRNPEFIDDAMDTIKGSVTRMSRVLNHLKRRPVDQPYEKVDVSKLIMQVESHCSNREPVPVVAAPDGPAIVFANPDRLYMALTHAVRNAQDATPSDGEIRMRIYREDGHCNIEISDTGVGMDEEFIRERLFRPFVSTKGAEGMGIGAYQIRETARAFGGDINVVSLVNQGTVLTLHLPLLEGRS